MKLSSIRIILAIGLIVDISMFSSVAAFVPHVETRTTRPVTTSRCSWMLPSMLSDDPFAFSAPSLVSMMPSPILIADTSEVIATLRTIAVGITAVLFFLAGLTLVMANIIIPAAANELEKECKELSPELWDEYVAKLESGQTMATRPDLIQELGSKLQPLLDAKIAQQQFDNEDEAWNTRPQVDLSALTDQMESPSRQADNMDKK